MAFGRLMRVLRPDALHGCLFSCGTWAVINAALLVAFEGRGGDGEAGGGFRLWTCGVSGHLPGTPVTSQFTPSRFPQPSSVHVRLLRLNHGKILA